MSGDMGGAEETIRASVAEVESLVTTFSTIADPFRRRSAGRWSAGENIDHLRLAVRPLNLALALPSFALRMFGRSRGNKSYEQVVEKYQGRLAGGAKATAPFVPARLAASTDPTKLVRDLRAAYATYASRLILVDRTALDSIVLPHPILGRLSLREMAYFTLYHLRHHHQAIRREGETP